MISQRKIAETLGVSTSTVANILNGAPNYKKETRKRVLETAAALGYQRNRASIAIQRGRSNLIGVIHFGSFYENASRAIFFIIKALRKHGYDYLIVDQRWHAGNVQKMLDEMLQSRVEGVVLVGSGGREQTFDKQSLMLLERSGIPVVSLYGDDYLDVPIVGDSNRSSYCAMANHLLSLGHRRILQPSLQFTQRSTVGKAEGFQMALEKAGECLVLEEDEFRDAWPDLLRKRRKSAVGIIVKQDFERYKHDIVNAYYEFGKWLFAANALPDAIMCANDRAACGIFSAAHDYGIKIPQDLAVTGCDDEFPGELPIFRLTTIRMDIARSSRAAMMMLMQRIKGKSLGKKMIEFPSELLIRRSCGRKVKPGDSPELLVPIESMPPRLG